MLTIRCGASCSVTCLVDGNIATAVTAWITSPTTAATTYGNIADWDVSAVSTMYQLFYNKPTFNADISKWNVASVTSMASMFQSATAFNVNIGSWNTALATNMQEMFYKATAFNQDISKWNVASVTVVTGGSGWGMFNGAAAFDQNLASWNVLRVTSLAANFDSASALSSCNKGAIYLAWGTTLRTAYPTFLSIASISSFSPLNAQVSGAATLTLLGANFQCSDLSPSAYVSGQPCATTAWTTTTQLVCAAPAPVLVGAGREAWVQVFTNTASRGFTFDGTTSAAWSRFGP